MPTKPNSRIQSLIRHALEENAARGSQGDLPEGKVTLRLPAIDVYCLAHLAELMDASRTRAASQLLSAAIRDAAQVAGLPTEGETFQADFQAFLSKEFPHETSPPSDA